LCHNNLASLFSALLIVRGLKPEHPLTEIAANEKSMTIQKTTRLFVAIATVGAIIWFYYSLVAANNTTIALTFLLVVLAIAVSWGLAEAVLASVLATLGLNFFFMPPLGRFTIAEPQNWIALAAFLITSITASQLSARAKRKTAEAIARRQEVERLYNLGQAMLLKGGLHTSGREILNRIMEIFEIPEAAYFSKSENTILRAGSDDSTISEENLRRAADMEEASTDAVQQIALVPVRLGNQKFGSIGFVGRIPSKTALNSIAYLTAIGIERARSLEETSRMEVTRQSETLKSALLDALAHDIKTPLTSIKGVLTHLLSGKQDPEEAELLSLANEETDRLILLAAEVIEMARIDAGKLHTERQPHAIAEIISACIKELEAPLQTRSLAVNIAENLPLADVDFDLAKQALKQLVDNAIKYSPKDSPVEIEAQLINKDIVISVCDNGQGIDETDEAHIFDKFYRGRRSSYDVKGTGLGLSIAKGMVEVLGGQVWFNSVLGKGSTFSFSLPVSKSESVQ
jgi:two-component system, OmpR family, sensor histidine kinase KdpD